MRLYDRLCVEQPRPCFGDDPFVFDEEFYDCVVFDIQQVADYFFALQTATKDDKGTPMIQMPARRTQDGTFEVWSNDYFGFDWNDIGCVIPVYEEMFSEYQAPLSMSLYNENRGEIPVGKVGCWITRLDIEDFDSATAQKILRGLAVMGIKQEDISFLVDIRAFADKPGNGGIMGPVVSWLVPLDAEGKIFLEEDDRVGTASAQPKIVWKPPTSLYAQDDALVRHFAQVLGTAIIAPALMALSVLHTPQEEDWHLRRREEPNKQHARKWVRRHGRPLVSYYVLEVGGVRQRMAEGGHRTIGGVLRALHSVRGHKRYYRRTFFGRTTHPDGRPITVEDPFVIFVPEHQRGSAKAGKVDKDYKVEAGAS